MASFKSVVEQVIAQAKSEKESIAHKRFREHQTANQENDPKIPGFAQLTKTGVIYTTSRATEQGFYAENPEWANLGQGAPETGILEGQPERNIEAQFNPIINEYAPVGGEKKLCQMVADLYNTTYRQGKQSQYTADNVCICPGGRAALSRIAACIGDVNVGYFLPDYTAYEQLLSVFKNFVPIPNALDASSSYLLEKESLKKEIEGRGLQVILTSNPGNPTGALLEGQALADIVAVSRSSHCSFIMDEFYSHYIYSHDLEIARSVSAAEYVDDVNSDAIVIVDGLTKNWRLPGWRLCWCVGPRSVIETMRSAGSFLDGGANHVLQNALIRSNLLDPEFVKNDIIALQRSFKEKRDYMLHALAELGITTDSIPMGTFYIWANVEKLPPPLNNGMSFFECALEYKVIVVPGIFFDVNPGKRRELFSSPYHHYIRISCGPSLETLKMGIDAFRRMIQRYSPQ